ncbi:MAG: hypothetical protein M3137_19180 [Actinomycetota bacterium]|nr:hypothetical protein [Actinomycetota bacterium]
MDADVGLGPPGAVLLGLGVVDLGGGTVGVEVEVVDVDGVVEVVALRGAVVVGGVVINEHCPREHCNEKALELWDFAVELGSMAL